MNFKSDERIEMVLGPFPGVASNIVVTRCSCRIRTHRILRRVGKVEIRTGRSVGEVVSTRNHHLVCIGILSSCIQIVLF